VIVLDDVGAGLLGSYDQYYQSIGRPSTTPASTPSIDVLMAQQGVSFVNAWSQPMCTPSRSSMLTGLHGSRTGQGTAIKPREENVNPGLDPSTNLLPQRLHSGPYPYVAAAVGKWHLASRSQSETDPTHPLGVPPGTWFDRFAGTWFNLEKPAGVTQFEAGYYVWEKHFATRVSMSVPVCASGEPPCDLERNANLDPRQYPTVDTFDDAITLVHELQEPWFMWIAPHAAHEPLHPVPNELPESACEPAAPYGLDCQFPQLTPAAGTVRCMIAALDAQVGRLLCEIDFNDTTVILVGDNGSAKRSWVPPYSGTHGKNTVYQGGLEVPLIVRSPVIPIIAEGTRSNALVSLVDVYATILDIAQAPAPSGPTDSISFLPCLTGQAAMTRTHVYAETFQPNFIPDAATGGPPAGYVCLRHDQALRDARFKLIRKWRRDHSGGAPILFEEFYDLVEGGPPDTSTMPPTPRPDWFETNDLLDSGVALDVAAQVALAQLRAMLDLEYPTLLQ
jgi:arylsulfatase A-like enzyme